MGKWDAEWAGSRLRFFIHAADAASSPQARPSRTVKDTDPELLESTAAARAKAVEPILDRTIPNWRTVPPPEPKSTSPWAQHRAVAHRALTALQLETELQDALCEVIPITHAGRLHPWVWQAARSRWASGHYSDAVVAALKKVNAEAQNKTGRHTITEADLFKQLFSPDPPKSGMPRLRLRDDEGSDTFKSAHRGAMALAEGLFAGIRNVVSHTVAETEPDEQHALEQLAAVSVLARWVHDARVETAP
jgi:uncharacterized protein (TIGR02391 family)